MMEYKLIAFVLHSFGMNEAYIGVWGLYQSPNSSTSSRSHSPEFGICLVLQNDTARAGRVLGSVWERWTFDYTSRNFLMAHKMITVLKICE